MKREKQQMIIKVCTDCSGSGKINNNVSCPTCNAKGKIKIIPYVPPKNNLTNNVIS